MEECTLSPLGALLPRCYARATETLREVAVKEHASCAAALEGIGQPGTATTY